MSTIRTRADTGKLFVDFRHDGKRYREQTSLDDTAANRKKLGKLVKALDTALESGSFDYASFFPDSKRAQPESAAPVVPAPSAAPQMMVVAPAYPVGMVPIPQPVQRTPLLRDFAETWIGESEVTWRSSYKRTVSDIVKKYFLPRFGDREVGGLTRAEVLQFRAELAKVPGRAKATLSPRRINAVMNVLGLI